MMKINDRFTILKQLGQGSFSKPPLHLTLHRHNLFCLGQPQRREGGFENREVRQV